MSDGFKLKNMKKITVTIGAALIIAVASCGKKVNPEAEGLLNDAQMAFDRADYAGAVVLLDSLQKAFPAEVAIQRSGMALRPKVIEQLTLIEIAKSDSAIAAEKAEAENLKAQLKWIKTPGMIEGYWTYGKSYRPDFMNTTGIEPRVSEIGEFYIVSSVNPSGGLKHTSIAISGNGGRAATPEVPYDGESNYRIDGGEIITFSPQASDTIGKFAFNNQGAPLTLHFVGKNERMQKLSPEQAAAISAAYRYSKITIDARERSVNREKLEKQLAIARSQIARTAEENKQ